MAISGKQRSRRIDRQYTSAVDPSIIWKRRLSWVALLIGLAYGGWLFLPTSAKQMSTGELSKAHHAWNQTGCEKCHAPLSPIKHTSFGRTQQAISENNDRCNSCHKISDHYPKSMRPEKLASESCVQCHHEHLGINHNLLDIADESCVRCHKDLSTYVVDANRKLAKITVFDEQLDGSGHPEFRSLAKDNGTIAFSHIQHMRPGQPASPNDPTAKTFASLSPRFKEQYKDRQDADGLVQLSCSDCHERDHAIEGFSGLENYFGNSKSPIAKTIQNSVILQSNEHTLYKPVEFSRHCQGCHELEVPHKLDLRDIDSLKDVIKASQLQQLSRMSRNQNIAPSVQSVFNEKTEQSASGKNIVEMLDSKDPESGPTIMRTYGCNKCHLSPKADSDPSKQLEIVQDSGIKTQWLHVANFTHGAHLNVQCKVCHQMDLASSAKPNDPNPPLGGKASQVIISGIATCRECHIADDTKRQFESDHGRTNVAMANCIQCHQYHHDPSIKDQPNNHRLATQENSQNTEPPGRGVAP